MKILVMAVAAVFAASAVVAQNSAPQPVLTGSQWQLVEMNSTGESTRAPGENAITLDFTAENTFGGSGGCNSYSGTYEASAGAIAFGDMVSTRMACGEQLLNQREDAYFAALSAVTYYELGVSRLTLFSDNGQVLRFAARGAYALIGSEWMLTAYGLPDAETAVDSSTTVLLTFVSSTEITGSGGCNTYSSTYSAGESSLSIASPASTRMACDAAIMQTEADFFTLLPAVDLAQISGDRLTLSTEDGQILRFVASGDYVLQRTVWKLLTLVTGEQSITAIEGNGPTLELRADGTAGGSGGCNGYGGEYTLDGDAVTFSAIMSTMMACMDAGVMEQESLYFTALSAVIRYEIVDGQLILHTPDVRLEFLPFGK